MDEQRLKKMALAAEVAGGVAVVITLVFLVMETRDNTRAIQANTYLSLTAELNRVRENLMEPDVAQVFALAIRDQAIPESLDDALMYRQIFDAAFSIYESAWFARQKGVLDDHEWLRFDQAICRNISNAAPIWEADPDEPVFGQGVRGVLTQPFVDYAEEHCDWPSIKAQLAERRAAAERPGG